MRFLLQWFAGLPLGVRRSVAWCAGLPVRLVATSSLLAGLVFSSLEAEGTISWGHEMLLVAVIPIALSGALRALLGRRDLE